MAIFELILGLLLAGVLLALLAPRLGVPWPALLALAGTVLAAIPGVPDIELDPQLALALFVAPVLLDSAYDTSLRDLRDNWRPVTSLVLIAVGLTILGVAFTARWLDPALSWPVALALGAIVAPPDAAAATSVLHQVRLPHRMLVILEGESLLNDASALLAFRVAVLAAMGGALGAWAVAGFVLAAAGGAVLGVVLARLWHLLAGRVHDQTASVVFQFLGTFGVWLLADALSLSAVLAVVAYGFTVARIAPQRTDPRLRRASYAVWEVVVFVLNILAFILMGLQLRSILGHLDGRVAGSLGFAAAIVAVVILVRLAWVSTYSALVRWKNRRFGVHTARPTVLPTRAGGLIVAWCGMRGIVTLASALALPEQFPHRELIAFTAFCVVLGTLVLQGLTLRPLLGRLTLPHDDSVERETRHAHIETARAALEALGDDRQHEMGHVLARKYEARINQDDAALAEIQVVAGIRRRVLTAQRHRLLVLRREGHIGDAAFHAMEETLDWAEVDLAPQER